ncbi:hypothetical protein Pmani_025094 [Petrolisthes manimaculis]|uniref:BTB domain-containing protein n=1 Tax=Petrolisthes manimaculis TaxID=1843537 RepID=A0AAE1P7X5_9EUCA|nr:hypothetical protein Pmani_025094 [Petrolisthes manimaculis]
MDRQSGVRQRTRRLPIPRSTSIQLRYEREKTELQKKITEQLVSDVFGLYEKSLLVDLKIETSRGNVYCHQLFFAARVPSLWRLLQEIAKFQHQPRTNTAGAYHSLVCVHLPDVEYRELQKFVRGLYSEVLENGCGATLRRQLEETLATLQQTALIHRHQLRIEKLSTQEEQRIQRLLLKQLRLGKFSTRKGDIRDVEKIVRCSDGVSCGSLHSDTDESSSAVTVKNIRNPTKSVRPKSSQQVTAQKYINLGNTMNITNHTGLNTDHCDIKNKQKTGMSEEVLGCYGSNISESVGSTSSQIKNGKIPLKISLPTKRTPSDDQSPTGQVSNQESPVFNVSMIKELQTSPMQVSGESFQDKLKDKKECSPTSSLRSSNSEFTLVEQVHPRQDDKKGMVYSNGDTGFLCQESVRAKEGKLHKYGAMYSTKENAVLHQASTLAKKQQLQHQHSTPAVLATKTCMQRKSLSFSAESQDSTDLDNASVSNSGSDHRLSNLHETSSLEVELPSSHEENSSSHESDESPAVSTKKWDSVIPRRESNHEPLSDDNPGQTRERKEQVVSYGCPPTVPRRLVRARTFEVLEGVVDGPVCETEQEYSKKEVTSVRSRLPQEPSGETVNSYRGFKGAKPYTGAHFSGRDNPVNGDPGRKVSDESTSSYHENSDDPEKLREMERKKGSLIFEHNFQTYSNIPTTNMMTASMMTASMSSESGSIGMGSLYSSMMDSALLGSIHSLGTLEAAIVDPIPRPASVGLPVMHSGEEVNPEIARRASHRPPSREQITTGEMAIELQQEMASRRQASNNSPSPDSLSVDAVARREAAEAREKEKHSRKTGSRKHSSEGNSKNIKKEEMDNEEKERDDRENENKSSDSSKSEEKEDKSEKKEMTAEDIAQKALTQITGSPKLHRELSENTPIVSGGSTLKREKDHGDRTHISKYERQVSSGSVKDVDSIPLVFGYIGPQEDDDKKNDTIEEDKKIVEKEDEKQSIFPMFIDLKDIPTPTEETKAIEKESQKPKPQSSAVYMYIEADSPSPKTRKKRKSESDGAAHAKVSEIQPHSEFMSLPPILGNAVPSAEERLDDKSRKTEKKKEGKVSVSEQGGSKEKKGFFMFIEADSSPKVSSPKPKRRPPPPPKKKSENAMSRSAPSDSLLFSTQDSSSKLMTKSVIDREEFIAQPPTRKNVSLNDKINESSSSRDGSFVSGIPRPIHTLRNKGSSSKLSKAKPSPCKRDSSTNREPSSSQTRDDHTISETNDMATSRDISASELGTSQSVSFSDAPQAAPAHENETSEVSDVSSLLSSIDRSHDHQEQGTSDSKSTLGEDLLRMFVNEINTDVTIQIGEKRIRAHKCILASRCVYFAAMLSGHWVESAGNVIKLQGFSAESVTVALKHIYSGTSTVPEGVRVGELAALSDMLALDGLKDVITLHLKAKMCHYFHKPCAGCLEGVLEVVPIAGAYCLDDLYHRCLRWVAKHFVVVLPTRNYAALPSEVQDRCLKQLLDDMSVSSVIDTALGCERVLASLPMVRWAQPVFDSAAQLLEAATSFIAANMSGVLASDRFLALGRDGGWSIDSLQDTMRVACELIRPDQAVLSHLQLAKILEQSPEDGLADVSEGFISFVEHLLNQIEKFMIHNANRVAVCRKWPLLSASTQRRIKDAALVVVEFSRPTAPRPRLSSANRRPRGNSNDGTGIPGRTGDHRLMRSASASAVPASQRSGVRRPPMSSQDPGRCHTPPASLTRPRTQTPPPTRASTLRAQARQAAIQRSQSARTVAERPRRTKQGNDTSTDEDTQANKRSTPVFGFTRGATFTRSLPRPEASHPLPQTPTRSSGLPSSRPRTPGIHEPSQLPRRMIPPQRTPSHTTTGSSTSEEDVPLKKVSTSRDHDIDYQSDGLGNKTKLVRGQSSEREKVTPTQRSELRTSTPNLSRTCRQPQDSKPSQQQHTDSGSRTPRTPKVDKGEPHRQIDVRNGNVTRTKATIGRRGARSPMREIGHGSGLATGRGTSPSPVNKLSTSLTESRSRSSSLSSKLAGSTPSLSPSVGSRSNTFCKDDNNSSNKKSPLSYAKGRESAKQSQREW